MADEETLGGDPATAVVVAAAVVAAERCSLPQTWPRAAALSWKIDPDWDIRVSRRREIIYRSVAAE